MYEADTEVQAVVEKGAGEDRRTLENGAREQLRLNAVTGRNEWTRAVPRGREIRRLEGGVELELTIRELLAETAGEKGLLGSKATKISLREIRVWWPGLARDVGGWVKGRGRDELTRYDRRGGFEMARHMNLGMFREVDADLTGPYKQKDSVKEEYEVTAVERFARCVRGGVSIGKGASKVRTVMRSTLWAWPVRPYLLRADNAFGEAREYRELSEELGFTWKIGSAYHPESQGAEEAANKTVKERIKLETMDADDGMKLEESLPGAVARVDRVCKEATGGLASNELTYGMLEETDENTYGEIILN